MFALHSLSSRKRYLGALVMCACVFIASNATANDWVYGTVTTLEDYGPLGAPDGNPFEVMVGLNATRWTSPGDASPCNQRFRIVTGQQNVTEQMKNRFFALLLSAYHTGAPVRLFYSTAGAPYCLVGIATIGTL